MKAFNKGSHILKLVFLLVVVFLFQNCSLVAPETKNGQKQSSSLGGDPYSGIEAKAGTYHYVVDDTYQCPGAAQAPLNNVAKSLEVFEGLDYFRLTDNCTGEFFQLPISALQTSVFNNHVLNISELIFQNLQVLGTSRDQLNRPIAKCLDNSKAPEFSVYEYFLFQNIVSRKYFAEIYFDFNTTPRIVEIFKDQDTVSNISFHTANFAFTINIDKSSINRDSTHSTLLTDDRSNDFTSAQSTSPTNSVSDRPISCYLGRGD